MKALRILITTVVLMSPTILWAAKKEKTAFVPKHEFTIQFSASCNGVTNQSSKDCTWYEFLGIPVSFFPAGFEYSYHFNDHWGITTGLGVTMHLCNMVLRDTHEDGELLRAYDSGLAGLELNPFIRIIQCGEEYMVGYNRFELFQMSVSLPLLAKYMYPFGDGGKWRAYVQGGLRFTYGFVNNGDDYFQLRLSRSLFMSSTTGIISEGEWKPISGNDFSECHTPLRPFNVYGCLEAGVRFPVYRAFGIYFGGYADLGFLRMVKYTGNQFLTYSTGINPSGSIFAAAEDKLNLTKNEKDYLVVSFSKEPMYKGILPFSAGIKIKFAF